MIVYTSDTSKNIVPLYPAVPVDDVESHNEPATIHKSTIRTIDIDRAIRTTHTYIETPHCQLIYNVVEAKVTCSLTPTLTLSNHIVNDYMEVPNLGPKDL